MVKVLNFGHRLRLTKFVKDLLDLPCMSHMRPRSVGEQESGGETLHLGEQGRGSETLDPVLREAGDGLHELDGRDRARLLALQAERLKVSRREDETDMEECIVPMCAGRLPEEARFKGEMFETPSAYIFWLLRSVPSTERLTRDQTLFVVAFANACDQVWKDDMEGKPWSERKVHHFLLLGQGGSGKTHVVQKIVFQAVKHIWPPANEKSQTLLVVAMSNAQAKDISTSKVVGGLCGE
jgi:hypothetical protein